jgi:DNA-binding FadR family transcriptional regulator
MTRLSTTKLPELLAAKIGADIVSGKLACGDELPSEQLLVETYGVSKAVVRAAIQQLATGSLVQVRHGRRTVVLPERQWDVLDRQVQDAFEQTGRLRDLWQGLYEVRASIEPLAARMAAQNATEAERKAIIGTADAMQAIKADPQSLDHLLELDHQLHNTIASVSGNLVLASMMRALERIVRSTWSMTHVDADDLPVLVAQHRAIAIAINRGDPQRAQQAMVAHMKWALQRELAENQWAEDT